MSTTAPTAGPGLLQRARDRVRPSGPWSRDAIWLVVLVGLLLLVGLVMTLSASFVADAESGDAFATFSNQVVFAVVGLVGFGVAARLHHDVWRLLSWPMLLIALIALVLVVIPGVGYTQYGSTRWIAIGPYICLLYTSPSPRD